MTGMDAMKAYNSKELIKMAEAAGWFLQRVRGSHHVFMHRSCSRVLVIPHPKKDFSKGILNVILNTIEETK
jgi:predicted RNA binding protein YcfA (HicA-like mRNA interferase family)